MAITKAERNARARESRAVVAAAYRDSDTLCCNCLRPLNECGPRGDGRNRNGTPCRWEAGHPDDADGPAQRYEPSARSCNRSRAAADGNRLREPGSDPFGRRTA